MAVTGKTIGSHGRRYDFCKGATQITSCAMLAATCTIMGCVELGVVKHRRSSTTQNKKVIAINALGVAPTGATADSSKARHELPAWPQTIGCGNARTPGGLMTMLAEYGDDEAKDVLSPPCKWPKAIYRSANRQQFRTRKRKTEAGPYSKLFFSALRWEARSTGCCEIFKQTDLLANTKTGWYRTLPGIAKRA